MSASSARTDACTPRLPVRGATLAADARSSVFCFQNRPSEKDGVCAQRCAQHVPETSCALTVQSPLVVAFSVNGDGLIGIAFIASLSSVSV